MPNMRCRNCGEQGHFASSCPALVGAELGPRPAGSPYYGWYPGEPRRSRDAQEMVNLRGRIKIRAAAAGAWDLFGRAAAVTDGTEEGDRLTAALAAEAAAQLGFEVAPDWSHAGRRPSVPPEQRATAQAAEARAARLGAAA